LQLEHEVGEQMNRISLKVLGPAVVALLLAIAVPNVLGAAVAGATTTPSSYSKVNTQPGIYAPTAPSTSSVSATSAQPETTLCPTGYLCIWFTTSYVGKMCKMHETNTTLGELTPPCDTKGKSVINKTEETAHLNYYPLSIKTTGAYTEIKPGVGIDNLSKFAFSYCYGKRTTCAGKHKLMNTQVASVSFY
jgi:hypothetical protein